jgi:hypothetical protein
MPVLSRTVLPAILATTLFAATNLPARAEALPTSVGACSETTITLIGGRLQGDDTFASGTAVLYANGGRQISYDREAGAIASRVGDPVRLCLASIPQGCPPDDDRGRIYVATNLRTGASWEMPDSSHMCGGA